MNKLSAFGVAGMGALAVLAAAPSQAGTASTAAGPVHTTITGNLEHTDPMYVCTKGFPNYVIAARAVKAPEKTVTVTDVAINKSFTLGPVTHAKALTLFAVTNRAGHQVSIKVHGDTSGSTFNVTMRIPTSCAGLPTLNADGSVTPAGATKPTKPATPSTKPATPPAKPSKPVTPPAKPSVAPSKPVTSSTPVKPSTVAPSASATSSAKPMGPKIQTDGAVSGSNDLSGVGAAAAGLALVGAGAVVARRRMN